MGDPVNKKMDDWIRLILLNWVMISFVMTYSIIFGTTGGVLLIVILKCLLTLPDGPDHFLTLYPLISLPSKLIIGTLIAAIFLYSFRTLRYNCQTGHYFVPASGKFIRKICGRMIGGLLVLSFLALILGLSAGLR
ncbi:hypothetical protein DENIS_1299 [Desulfonema ishimotonii]|uniref:Uncharacterized protein n=1 Tax=Desulfonema ishimotonii TaxID=45657 RepID=A0A401FTS6_9BACT|nr:hypothetical protein [Desulfonema ishimotonii]GBC60348.1 hypothetical protein DENIS_1299 [Desulfonema ishimotonii]